MRYAGIRELKNRLTYYIDLTRKGGGVIVTDRGKPVAILHTVETVEQKAGIEGRLVWLAGKGLLRLPLDKARMRRERPKKIKGKPVSEIIAGDRR